MKTTGFTQLEHWSNLAMFFKNNLTVVKVQRHGRIQAAAFY